MPSMYVNVPKLEQGTKDALAAKLYDAAAPVLPGARLAAGGAEFEPGEATGPPAPPQSFKQKNPPPSRGF